MGQYFADLAASRDSQFFGTPHGVSDSEELCRRKAELAAKPDDYALHLALADAYSWQLRFREAIDVLSQTIEQNPEALPAYQKRGAKYLDTLQFEKALADYEVWEEQEGSSLDTCYRRGLANYMLGRYDAARDCFSTAMQVVGTDDMYIAVIYWLTLSNLRCGRRQAAQELLRAHYAPGMFVGHHTAYEKAMRVCARVLSAEQMIRSLENEPEDLEYCPAAYGISVWLESNGHGEQGRALREKLLSRQGFWFSFGYLAAYADHLRSE